MDIRKLLGLRPKDESAAAIAAAIASTEERQAAALARAAKLEMSRGELLLTADPKVVDASEQEMSEARMEAERCGVMATALKDSLAQAKHREKVTEITAAAERANQEVNAFVDWWEKDYEALALKIREGLLKERRALDAIHELLMLQPINGRAWDDAQVALPKTPAERVGGRMQVTAVSVSVRLPTLDLSNDDSIWPPQGSPTRGG